MLLTYVLCVASVPMLTNQLHHKHDKNIISNILHYSSVLNAGEVTEYHDKVDWEINNSYL